MNKRIFAVLFAVWMFLFTACGGESAKESKENALDVADKLMAAYTSCDKAALSQYVAEGISTREFEKTYKWMDTCIEYDATMTYETGEVLLYEDADLIEFCSKSGVPRSKVKKVAAVYVDIETVQGGEIYERNAYIYIGLVDGKWLAVYPDNM